jgi:ureidoglycolate lyase
MPDRHRLQIEPLNRATFRPYGDVIEAGDAAQGFDVNRGDATRYHDLAAIDVSAEGGRPLVSIFRARPHTLPFRLTMFERHPLGSQAFMPLGPLAYLVVVAMAGPAPLPSQLRCFRAGPGQGVNYGRGTWHHPLLALQSTSDFLVIDRGGPAPTGNCEEFPLDEMNVWVDQP